MPWMSPRRDPEPEPPSEVAPAIPDSQKMQWHITVCSRASVTWYHVIPAETSAFTRVQPCRRRYLDQRGIKASLFHHLANGSEAHFLKLLRWSRGGRHVTYCGGQFVNASLHRWLSLFPCFTLSYSSLMFPGITFPKELFHTILCLLSGEPTRQRKRHVT